MEMAVSGLSDEMFIICCNVMVWLP